VQVSSFERRNKIYGKSSNYQLADAFRYQASGVHFGKVVVEW
jgi:hypothetical protein